jgi:hypothetical protein
MLNWLFGRRKKVCTKSNYRKECTFRGMVVQVIKNVEEFARIVPEGGKPLGLLIGMDDFTDTYAQLLASVPNYMSLPSSSTPFHVSTENGPCWLVCAECETVLPDSFIFGLGAARSFRHGFFRASTQRGLAGRCPKCGCTNAVIVFAPTESVNAIRHVINRLPHKQRLPLLISASQSENHNVVTAAAEGLGKARGPYAVAALLPLLKHSSHKICLAATAALSKMGCKKAITEILALDPEKILDPVVLKGLARLGAVTQATDVLRTALEQAPHEKKIASLEILAKNTSPDKIAALQSHFAGTYTDELNSEEWSVRNRAVKALGRIGGPLAIKALKERLKIEKDYEIKRYITEELGLKGE